ncbi:hypothetical protein HDF24_11635 [Mucilaginibacter sp. X4EP1]|uniref:hypothetical protein n=1 Tax=Mucilaginibacter sp. X4EP1 TaxID=2723092 RepID=UPI0021684B70|nr:hypothetical protein [Mucilaginibacter sp. X4EP1]MCS3812908.1 hypothetical protein [Mucilaginibacter sp. X4EP1]
MDFVNVEIIRIAQYDFEIFDTKANEYYEDLPIIKYGFEPFVKDLNYTFYVSFTVTQRKENKGAIIRVKTTFKILTSEEIPNPLDEETIRLMSDLFYISWAHTIALLNIRCYQSIFTDNYLSKRSIREFYEFLKENHTPLA